MFEYYFQQLQPSSLASLDSRTNETCLLATSRNGHHQHHEHLQMLKEDCQALFYHKLNAIIQLEQLEQLEQQSTLELGTLSQSIIQELLPDSRC